MTREIKFRAWDVNANKMLEPWQLSIHYPKVFVQKIKNGDGEVRNVELMQFTGLKDKNGKEIYEGDIVRVPDDYEEYGFMAGEQREIYYLDGCFRLKPKKENTRDRGNTIMDDMDKCEIIGNIYENPNLLN